MTTTSAPPMLDLNNVQGDILIGLPKKTQTYFLFQIITTKVKDFRTQLNDLIPLITTATQAIEDRDKIAHAKRGGHGLVKLSGTNIGISRKGFTTLGITDKLGDTAFDEPQGMLGRAQFLGDPGTTNGSSFSPNWLPEFKNDIHGVILISGDSHETVTAQLKKVKNIFKIGQPNASIEEIISICGHVRPGKEKAHEHFGFLDGISQPAIEGIDTKPNPGQDTVPQGIFLIGRDNDPITTRPSFTLDGSLLAFRYLPQLVPEFNDFLSSNPIAVPGITSEQGSELRGARLVGRWKSGAPIDVFPTADDPKAGADPAQNNDFRYAFPNDQGTQDRCPFAAHTRKTNPRADLEDPPIGVPNTIRRILRRGIQFGPEVTAAESASGKTENERGLLFAAYQSVLDNGFEFIQHSWANNVKFPPKANIANPVPTPGFDPIIGQASNDGVRTLVGTDPSIQGASLSLPVQWVVPKGGEYFFVASIPALKTKFALPASSREL
nr:dye decolorizing peroxidase [uncultured fungus]